MIPPVTASCRKQELIRPHREEHGNQVSVDELSWLLRVRHSIAQAKIVSTSHDRLPGHVLRLEVYLHAIDVMEVKGKLTTYVSVLSQTLQNDGAEISAQCGRRRTCSMCMNTSASTLPGGHNATLIGASKRLLTALPPAWQHGSMSYVRGASCCGQRSRGQAFPARVA